ncbi:hypothetical protein BH09PSE5_BH09PSE5_05330 [soil metagenome]
MLRLPVRRVAALSMVAAGAALLAMLANHRDTPGSMLPHGYCFTWNPALLWTHVVSDSLIGLAYVSIPLTLLHLVRRRSDLPFNWIVLLFAVFIVSCGATHFVEVWTVWSPDYWLSGNLKLITAVASVLTAAALIHLVPSILAIPTLSQLQAAKEALEEEVRARRLIEEELRQERADLESRVEARTRELAEAKASAEAAHAEADQANRQKDQFLAKVSHELRTPLQSTLSWVQVLQLAGTDKTRSVRALERIVENVRSQARLIDDLLDISRILSGKMQLHLQEAPLMAVVEKAVDVVSTAARSKKVTIELVDETAGAIVMTDPARLEQVVWNLIGNAVQSSSEGGRVRVLVRASRAQLQVDVEDWGRGIDPADLAGIFEPFRQGNKSDNTHRGLGLGLAIARNIALLFGGTLRASSEGLGRGACFSVVLPLLQRQSGPQPMVGNELSSVERDRLQGLRVVYVEDDADIAEGGRATLEALGAQVELCLTFEQASARVRTDGFDVLLSDLSLDNGHDGVEVLRLLRGTPHGRQMTAVLLSAYGSEADVLASLAAGFARHMVKPVNAADVARVLIEVTRAN